MSVFKLRVATCWAIKMYCHGCGKEILNSSAFCPVCGTKTAAQRNSVSAAPSTVAHGRSFEKEVGEWLESTLGHRVVQRNERVKCASELKPYECDVHTRTYTSSWNKIQKAGLVAFVFAVLLMVSRTSTTQDISGLLLIGIGLVVISAIKKCQRNYHVWVECKNLRTKVNRDQIIKLQTTTDRLRKNPDADWKPDFVLCFSATDFERDALAIARQHGIECYRRSGNGFREVT